MAIKMFLSYRTRDLIELYSLGTSLSWRFWRSTPGYAAFFVKKVIQTKKTNRVVKICEIIRPDLCQAGLTLNGF